MSQLLSGDDYQRREPAAAWLRRATLRLGVVLAVCSVLLLGAGVLTTWSAPAGVVVVLLAGAGLTAALVALRRELGERVVDPLEQLAESSRRLAGGELDAPFPRQGTAEMLQVAGEIASLSRLLAQERRTRLQEAGQVERRTSMVRQLLKLTQEVGSSLAIERVLAATAQAALTIGGHAAAVIWFPDEVDGSLRPAWDTRRPGGPYEQPPLPAGQGAVGRAASLGQIVTVRNQEGPDELAIPILLGLNTLGVIELVSGGDTHVNRADDFDALEVLARHAATAVEASRLHGEMERRSDTDGLTRVFNRRRFDGDLRFEVSRAVRYGRPLALVMVDVDHFKSINDTFGHPVGDEVLKTVGATLMRECRTTDGAYRYGGEEFAVMLRDTDAAAAEAVAERYRTRISEGVARLGLPRVVTASLGVGAVGQGVDTAERLVDSADAALFKAKNSGRNRVAVAAAAG